MSTRPRNLILLQIDSLCRHFLPCYGNTWVQAPNLAAFAERALIYDRHYAGSLPCMPARREIWAGSEEFWWRWWGPLEPWDRSLAFHLRALGVTTQLITDHYHLFEWGSHSYHCDYAGYEFIRGHEFDNWRTRPLDVIPEWAGKMVEKHPLDVRQYLRNVRDFDGEADFFGPRVMQSTSDWLRENARGGPFFLHVDCFDIHEPFHVPEPYRSLYTDADHTRFNPWPLYGRTDAGWAALGQEEIDWVRAQFAGKLTMVDRWLGRVFDALEQTGLWDETIVIITTDHGHFLGEHGWIGKPGAPLYDELRHLPLLVWHPDAPGGGRRVPAITQTVDLHATILDLLGTRPDRAATHARSFAATIEDPERDHRALAISGYNNERVAISDREWTLLRTHEPGAAPPYVYTQQIEQVNNFGLFMREYWRREDFEDIEAGHFIPGTGMPVWRMLRDDGEGWDADQPPGDLLFHADDVSQLVDRSAAEPAVVARLERALARHAVAIGAPEEQLMRLRLARPA